VELNIMSELTHVEPIRQKAQKTALRVRIGRDFLRDKKASNVFCSALQAMGLENVASVNVSVCGLPLVSRTAPPLKNGKSRSYQEIDGWFIITHSSTRDKKAVLEQVAEKLQIPLQVTILTQDEVFWDALDGRE
jgi:hypothetical protein